MCFRKSITGILLTALSFSAGGQDTWYGSLAGMHVMYNPAFAGSSGMPALNISCYSFLPGVGYKLYSVYASYDDYIDPLHGGIAAWISDDMPGEVLNDLRSGLAYSYHFKAGRKLFINAGLTASIIHLGINRGSVVFPEDYDPFSGLISPASETIEDAGATLFDAGTGFTFSSERWYGGFSVMHLTQPYLSHNQQNYNRLKRLYTVTAGLTLPAGHNGLIVYPSATFMVQDGRVTGYLGVITSVREVSFGLAAWHITSGISAIEPSLGWNAGSTTITLSYSYNISGNRSYLPATAVAKAAFKISFINVNKRKVIHVIKLPEL